MKIVSIVGARPQFIKAASISRALKNWHQEILVHTGQHYDYEMSEVFFAELELPLPQYQLNVGSASHGVQTGRMLIGIEEVLIAEQPDWVLVYGDTNSTIAGTLAAAKLHLKVAHIEAGLRSFNRDMPEEINRVLADHLSTLLLCPSETAKLNLKAEGIEKGVHVVGDIMADALLFAREKANKHSSILNTLNLKPKSYLLTTVHRAENTDNEANLLSIIHALDQLSELVVFPVHPRTRAVLDRLNYKPKPHVLLLEPVGYFNMLMLEESARLILTDSGGVQKEAYWLGIPCITLRNETEWIETVQLGWNILVGANDDQIIQAVQSFKPSATRPVLYGDGHSAECCIKLLE